MKAGGSGGHGLVLSCQGAECHPSARCGMGVGDPLSGSLPARPPSPPSPPSRNAGEQRGEGEEAPLHILSLLRRKGERDGCEVPVLFSLTPRSFSHPPSRTVLIHTEEACSQPRPGESSLLAYILWDGGENVSQPGA